MWLCASPYVSVALPWSLSVLLGSFRLPGFGHLFLPFSKAGSTVFPPSPPLLLPLPPLIQFFEFIDLGVFLLYPFFVYLEFVEFVVVVVFFSFGNRSDVVCFQS
jgi:hypothetical protein